jgi:hypothetical protein
MPPADLVDRLREQLQFIDGSCRGYDHGDIWEATRLAVPVRVLLHDTAKSHSLLAQLAVKESFKYLDTTLRSPWPEPDTAEPNHLLSDPGLAAIAYYEDSLEYVPRCYTGSDSGRWVDFHEWWQSPISRDVEGRTLWRRHIVLQLANNHGGAHVDARSMTPAFRGLLAGDVMGWKQQGSAQVAQFGDWQVFIGGTGEGHEPTPPGSPVPAIMRQIAEELRRSVRDGFPELLGPLAEPPADTSVRRQPTHWGGRIEILKGAPDWLRPT